MARLRLWALISALIVLFAGATLRLTYLNWGLPYIYHPDEPVNLSVTHIMIRTGDLNPHRFNYPSLLYYLALPGQLVVRAVSSQRGKVLYMQTMGNGWMRQPASLQAARLTIALVSVALIAVVMLWTARVFEAAWPGILAGALVTVNPILVRHSTLFTPDVLSAFFVTLALFGASLIVMRGRVSDYVFAGVAAGLAASSKYNAGLVAVAIAVAHWQRFGFRLHETKHLLIAALASVAALLATSPFLLLDFQNGYEGFTEIARAYASGHSGAEGDSTKYNAMWLFQLTGATGIAVIGLALNDRAKPLVPAAVFVVAYFVLLAVQEVRFERNIIPIIPAVLVLATGGFFSLVDRFNSSAARAVICVLFLLAYVGPLSRTVSELASYERDERAGARAWLNELIPHNASVLIEAYSPFMTGYRHLARGGKLLRQSQVNWIKKHDYVVFTRLGSGRFLRNDRYRAEQEKLNTLRHLACAEYKYPKDAREPDYIVLQFSCASVR